MLDQCNMLGAIVTCGGGGLLVGVSVAAFLSSLRKPDPMNDVLRRQIAHTIEAARGRLALADDDLEGIPTPDDVQLAKGGIRWAADALENIERHVRSRTPE